ncbi:MAG: di-heme enzyme, partial [Myxococcota bacterium]
EAAFEDSEIDWGNIVFALASFSRSLISGNSPFDRFAYQGDSNALSASAQAGIEVFFSETTECHHCHGGFNFTLSTLHENSVFEAEDFHNTGLYNLDESGSYPPGNTGVHDVTGDPEDMGKFRAPSLRNVALTAPYMHDGSIETLEEVIRTYEAGGREVSTGPFAGDGRANPHKSGFVQGFTLTDQEREDLIAFLESLTDTQFTFDPRFSDPFSQ